MISINLHNGCTREHLGFIPEILADADDGISARDRINGNYAHGGGWSPFGSTNWKRTIDTEPNMELIYDGDERYKILATITLDTGETCRFFECQWMMLEVIGGGFEISRMD